jgi:hypothetical protein
MAKTNRVRKASDEQLEALIDKNPPGTVVRQAALEELLFRRRGSPEDRRAVWWISLAVLVCILLAAWFLFQDTRFPPAKPPISELPPSPVAPANPSTLP